MIYINIVFLIIGGGFLLLFAISSLLEREKRAALFSFTGFIFYTAAWGIFIFTAHIPWLVLINQGVIIASLLFIILSLLKINRQVPARDMRHAQKYDERDMMFARNNLKFHPALAERYYAAHPEKKEVDRKIHAKAELEEPGHTYYNELGTPLMDAAFGYLARTRFASRGEPAAVKKELSKEQVTQFIKYIARFYGAVDVGITQLQPYHYYIHAGRHAEVWGDVIEEEHSTAIVIIVAMDTVHIKQAPALPAALEASHQYVEAAKIANVIAQYIRSFGYDARAQTDGNYQVCCVPLAIDAGLGELGRLGIYMHPVYGPCVRISVVTTDLELVLDRKKDLSYIAHFCQVCKKCAQHCPSRSIPMDEEPQSRGFRHWSIDQEKCFSLWKTYGTDCAVCVKVCPYTKPNTFIHKMARFYISRNAINRRIGLFLDNLLYPPNF